MVSGRGLNHTQDAKEVWKKLEVNIRNAGNKEWEANKRKIYK